MTSVLHESLRFAISGCRGKLAHLLPAGQPVANGLALCGFHSTNWWFPNEDTMARHGQCKECHKAAEKARVAATDPSTSAVYCAHCGKPSDRGFIQSCRACSGLGP